LIFIKKKSNKIKILFFLEKPKPVQTDRFRFGFLGQKRFKPVWFGFFGLARFFRDKNRFNRFWLGFFGLTRFFAGLAWFFFGLGLARLFFSGFLDFLGFLIFLLTPIKYGVSKMHGGHSRLPIKETTKKDT
jgi:hypothetical protein